MAFPHCVNPLFIVGLGTSDSDMSARLTVRPQRISPKVTPTCEFSNTLCLGTKTIPTKEILDRQVYVSFCKRPGDLPQSVTFPSADLIQSTMAQNPFTIAREKQNQWNTGGGGGFQLGFGNNNFGRYLLISITHSILHFLYIFLSHHISPQYIALSYFTHVVPLPVPCLSERPGRL